MSFTVQGLDALAAKLRGLPDKVARKSLRKAAMAGAEVIRARMEELAPRGDPATPNISDIVMSPVRTQEEHVAIVAIGPQKDAFYGFFWEYGWKHHKAEPFARPALDEEHEAAQAAVNQELWREINYLLGSRGSGGSGGLL